MFVNNTRFCHSRVTHGECAAQADRRSSQPSKREKSSSSLSLSLSLPFPSRPANLGLIPVLFSADRFLLRLSVA